MKLLIFCTRQEKSALIDQFALAYEKHTVMSVTNSHELSHVLEAFKTEPRAILILDIKASATGFSVASDTLILFSRDCPDGALREQAAARNRRL